MKPQSTAFFGLLLSTVFVVAYGAEYGGRWTDESIREKSFEYIEGTKKRFERRAARLEEVTGSPFPPRVSRTDSRTAEVLRKVSRRSHQREAPGRAFPDVDA